MQNYYFAFYNKNNNFIHPRKFLVNSENGISGQFISTTWFNYSITDIDDTTIQILQNYNPKLGIQNLDSSKIILEGTIDKDTIQRACNQNRAALFKNKNLHYIDTEVNAITKSYSPPGIITLRIKTFYDRSNKDNLIHTFTLPEFNI